MPTTQTPRTMVYERPWMYDLQLEAFFSPERYSIIEGSTKSGKTVSCMLWLAEEALKCTVPGRNYWWVAPIYGQAKIPFRRLKAGLPKAVYTANESELTITFANGAVIWFKGADKPDSLFGEDVYAAVIDEASRCFIAGTLVQTPSGMRPIETLAVGDAVCNAVGVGRVRRTIKKRAQSLAVVSVQGYNVVSSIDHRYLTRRGWVEAQNLERTDVLVSQSEAVCVLRQDVHATTGEARSAVLHAGVPLSGEAGANRDAHLCVVRQGVYGSGEEATYAPFLRSELLREVENDAAGRTGESVRPGSTGESAGIPPAILARGYGADTGDAGRDSVAQRDARSRCGGKGVREFARAWSSSARPWWKRITPYGAAATIARGVGRRVLRGVVNRYGREANQGRVADTLLPRYRRPYCEDCDRDRRFIAPRFQPSSLRCTEDRLPGIARVDSVEILQSGDSRFCEYSGGSGSVELYDLQVSGHPSFAVNGFLVHNCKEEAWYAVRSTLTQTRGPVRIIGNVKGRRNWAYQLARRAEAGEPGYRYTKITALDAVAAGVLAQSEIDDARQTLPDAVFKELYMCIPSDDGGNPFGLAAIAAQVAPLSLLPPVVWGWDLAKSVDWTVGVALDARGTVCRFERWQGPWETTTTRIVALTGRVPALVDSTGAGDPVLGALQARAPGVFEGYHYSQASKQKLMEGLALAIQQHEIRYPEGVIVRELEEFEYVYTRTGVKYSAPQGLHDDAVNALALARQRLVTRGRPFEAIGGGARPVQMIRQ